MAHGLLLFRDAARTGIPAGVAALADAVRGTLGPRSRCVSIEKKGGGPVVCDDGVTSGQVISDELGLDLGRAPLAHLGFARRVVVILHDTTLIEGRGAMGGGLALLRAIEAVAREEQEQEGDEATGPRIPLRAVGIPARPIALSSGAEPGVVVDRMRSGTGRFGFDARRNPDVDLLEAGIIDATKVGRRALPNAVSVARLRVLAEATMTGIEDEKPDRSAPNERMAWREARTSQGGRGEWGEPAGIRS